VHGCVHDNGPLPLSDSRRIETASALHCSQETLASNNKDLGEIPTESTHIVASTHCGNRNCDFRPLSRYGRAALWNRAGHYIFAMWFLYSSIFLLLFSSPRSEIGCLPYFYTWCGLSANLECRSEMCCMRLTEKIQDAKIAISAPSHNFVGPYLRN